MGVGKWESEGDSVGESGGGVVRCEGRLRRLLGTEYVWRWVCRVVVNNVERSSRPAASCRVEISILDG